MAVTFCDLAGRLDVLRVECPKCGRSGRYRVGSLVADHGEGATLIEWRERLTADCARQRARKLDDQCGARFPDLSGLPRWRQAMHPDGA